MLPNQINRICNKDFSALSKKLHKFFWNKNFTEAYYQNHLDILTACENPKSIGKFKYFNEVYPLRQTNQMGLEYAILDNPDNYYCFTTSYRFEPEINKGRHNTVFPMCEFEIQKGSMEDLIEFEKELIRSLGYSGNFFEIDYEEACEYFKVEDIDDKEEDSMCKTFAPVVFLKNFPERTNPFFNMKKNKNGYFDKVDVLMLGKNTFGEVRGMETIGSAVRSCDIEDMKKEFKTSVNGEFSKTLYDNFGKERVDKELNEFFSKNMIPRSGGGIGFTRLLNFARYYQLI